MIQGLILRRRREPHPPEGTKGNDEGEDSSSCRDRDFDFLMDGYVSMGTPIGVLEIMNEIL